MKKSNSLKKSLALILFAATVQGPVQASTPVEQRVPVTHVYAPKGFDNNDRTEIIVTGFLPNLCHRFPTSTVKVEGMTIKVELTSLYYESDNPFCPKMVVPFEQTVKVGVLEKGNYQIVVNDGQVEDEKALITIQEASSQAIDENVYAAVDTIVKNEERGEITLKGYNPSDCYVLDQIKSISNNKDSYSILPVMKQVYSFCPMKLVPFSVDFAVPTVIPENKVLLHVRSMAGNSVNSIFSFKKEE